ncbi:MAG: flavin reductase family protein [Chloroflexaceae bacterium]|nr:flavin reductase family protein [Chloroflexaceae bacterium]
MEISVATLDQREVYKLMSGCILPRPIAWVSTQDRAGCRNLAPFSFFNGVASNPPSLSVSISASSDATRPLGTKDTLRNILETGEFVVNVVTEATVEAMVETSREFPADEDEFSVTGLTPVPSVTVRPPRVAESPVSFECVLHGTMQVGRGPGSSTLVVGIIQHLSIRDDLLNERGYVEIRRLQPVGRLAGSAYCAVREVFDLKPKV